MCFGWDGCSLIDVFPSTPSMFGLRIERETFFHLFLSLFAIGAKRSSEKEVSVLQCEGIIKTMTMQKHILIFR